MKLKTAFSISLIDMAKGTNVLVDS